jgi:glycosyltransferase involved in cell wall biosynthesis
MKLLVFIPAYRCAPQITRVLDQFDEAMQARVHTVMVVDNQSPDQTLSAAIERGKAVFTHCRFMAWRNQDNYGLGGSHKAAFRYAIAQGFDHLLVLHGDDQGRVQDAISAIDRIEAEGADCFLGARFMRGSDIRGYSRFRTFGNRVYNGLFSLVAGHRIFDLGSGLNLYRLKAFEPFYYKKFPDDLTFNYVMLLGSLQRQQTVSFFPISWREEDQLSNVRLFRQAFKVLKLLAGFAVARARFLQRELRAPNTQGRESYPGDIVYDSANRDHSA